MKLFGVTLFQYTLSLGSATSFLPFFINGYSWGGQFGYHFTKWLPERVVGFITQKGGYHDTTNAGDAIEVPGLMLIGENDLPYRIENLTEIFLNHQLIHGIYKMNIKMMIKL